MSNTISVVIIQLLATFLPMLGISVGTEQLTQAIQTLVVVGTGLYLWYHRVSKGDVNVLGVRR